jgi:hypothetical protein
MRLATDNTFVVDCFYTVKMLAERYRMEGTRSVYLWLRQLGIPTPKQQGKPYSPETVLNLDIFVMCQRIFGLSVPGFKESIYPHSVVRKIKGNGQTINFALGLERYLEEALPSQAEGKELHEILSTYQNPKNPDNHILQNVITRLKNAD